MPPRAALLLAMAVLTAPSQEPTIRVSTRLVQVSVIVQQHGRPVADLQHDDFALFDRGKPQRIAFCSVYLGTASSAQAPSADAPRSSAPSAKPAVYSNHADDADSPHSVTIILLDGLNTALEDQHHVRDGVLAFLSQVRPQDRIALYTLGREVRVLHDFTDSTERLLQAAARYRGRIPIELDSAEATQVDPTGNSDLDQFLQGMQEKFSDVQHEERALRTLAAMEAIANHVAALPGRKNLVWISGGFPFTLGTAPLDDSFRGRRTFIEDARRAALAVSNAGVAIYPVDARGLRGDRDSLASSDVHSSKHGPGGNVHVPTPVDQNLDSMSTLADRTGGRAFFNTVDFQSAIARAVDDAQVTYTLGFYPDAEPDSHSHELKVTVKRPGVEVRYRKAYLALADEPPSPETWKGQVQRAIVSPVSSSQIGIDARLENKSGQPGAYRLLVRLNGPDLPLQRQRDQWIGALDLMVVQVRADGKVVNTASTPLQIALPEDKFKSVLDTGLRLTLSMETTPGVAFAQVLALDAAHGRIGSLRLPLH